MRFTLTTPFAGSYHVCGPDKDFSKDTEREFSVTGTVSPAPGVISFLTAKQKMERQLWQAYKDKHVYRKVSIEEWNQITTVAEFNELVTRTPAEYQDTLYTIIDDWVYRVEGAGYWVFKLRVMYGDQIGHLDHELIIRVDNTGNVCVVQHYDYADFEYPRLDIRKDAIQCP